MYKKDKSYDSKGELLSIKDMRVYEPSLSKEIESNNQNSNIYNQVYYDDINKNNQSFRKSLTKNYKTTNPVINNQAYHQLKKININKSTQNTDEKNRRIIQKERLSNNIPSNYYTNPNQSNYSQKILLQKHNSSNIYMNTSQNNIQNQTEKKIKNIPISLKKINLNRKRSFSKKSQPEFNTSETFINKSPYIKRKPSEGLDYNNNRNRPESNINTNTNSNLYTHISPRKQYLIPKPNQKYTPKKRNSFNIGNNFIYGNKKMDRNLVEQSKDIKRQFKEIENGRNENEILRKKNEYFLQKGILLEKRITYEAFSTMIQAYFRGYYIRKRFYSLIDNCIKIRNAIYLLQKVFSFRKYNIFNILKKYPYSIVLNNKIKNTSINFRSRPVKKQLFYNNDNNLDNEFEIKENYFRNVVIDKNNHIEINIPKEKNAQNIIIDKNNCIEIYLPKEENKKENISKERKYILKYILLKKEKILKNKMRINFEKYKNNIINDDLKNKEKDIISKENLNEEESKMKLLRNIVRIKILKEKEKMHAMLLKFYYGSLYVHVNWYMYVINQLNYYQSLYQNNPPNNYSQNNINEVTHNNNELELQKKLSIENINEINEAISNEAEENKKIERQKHLKELVLKKIKEMENEFHQMFTKFYYQGRLLEKSKNQNDEKESNTVSFSDKNNEEDILDENIVSGKTRLRSKTTKTLEKKDTVTERRNKARNLRKLMMKKEKDKLENLRAHFYKFHTNGMLFILKKNSKLTKTNTSPTGNSNLENNENNKLDDQNNDKNKLEEIKELTLLDKKRIEEEKKKKELEKKRIEILKSIFYKKDRQITLIQRKTFEKWNLRAKLFSLADITKSGKREIAKSVRFKKKKITKNNRTKSEYKRDNNNNNKEEEDENI